MKNEVPIYRFLATILLGTLSAAGGIAQTEECGTVIQPEEIPLLLALEEEMSLDGPTLSLGETLIVPLAFHVVRRSNGSGGLSQSRLNTAVSDANNAYSAAGISFFQCGETDYLNNDTYYFDVNTSAEINALRSVNVVSNAINIYFTPNFPYCGISSFPGSSVQGIIMLNSCTATSSNHSTFAHEIGHYLSLYHTHETAFGTECTSGSNCSSAGDRVCDTPADPRLGSGNVSSSCVYSGGGVGPCGGDPAYAPDVRNYMSYSRKSCRNRFSTQQNNRARSAILNLRPELLGGCSPPELTSVAPAIGQLRGGNVVTLLGANFRNGGRVFFDGIEGTILPGLSQTALTVRVPEGQFEGQVVEVAISLPAGSDQLPSAYSYTQNDVAISFSGSSTLDGTVTIDLYGPSGRRAGFAVGAPGETIKPCCTFCLQNPIDLVVRPSELQIPANGRASFSWTVTGFPFETKNIQGLVLTTSGPVVTSCQSLTVFP